MKKHSLVLALALSAMPCLVPVATAQPEIPNPPASTKLVYIMGEVVKPGAYKIKTTDNLSSLLALAGGPTQKAGLNEIRVHSVGGGYTIDLPQLEAKVAQAIAEDLPLQDGDVITVPVGIKKVYVMGAVAKPGYYVLLTGKTLSVNDVLALAGGAKLGKGTVELRLLRRSATWKLTSAIVEGKSRVQPDDIINVIARPKDSKPKFKIPKFQLVAHQTTN